MEIKQFHDLENGSSQTGMSAPEFLEKEPVGLVPGIEIKNLKKVFSTEKGLTWVSYFFIYQGSALKSPGADLVRPPGVVLPYIGCIGMCRCEGYGFQAVYYRTGYINQNVWV